MAVSLMGIGQAPATLLSLNPNQLSFAAQVLNTTSAQQYFYIYNRGTTAITLGTATITGTNSGDFAIASTTCTSTIAVNGTCYYYVTFDPSAVGPRTASVQISDNAAGNPQSLVLTGIGQSALSALRFDPVNLVFPMQAVSTTSSAMNVQLYNDGNVPLTISAVSLTGGNNSDFSITNDTCPISPSVFAVGGTCYVYVDLHAIRFRAKGHESSDY